MSKVKSKNQKSKILNTKHKFQFNFVSYSDNSVSPHTNRRLVVERSGDGFGLLGSRKSFTLVELMIVIAILAILSAIVIFSLNPGRLFDNFRDTRRVSDINTINQAINFIETWNTNGIAYGSNTTVYISLPDTSATCASYSLPTLPTGYTYSCKTTANYRKVDGTGWIPIDFSINPNNAYLSVLPIDPVNDSTYFYTYYSGGSYEVTALLKNPNSNSINDDDSLTGAYTKGSPNRTWTTPLSRDTNLIGHWKFDEGAGTIAYDSSGNGRNGKIVNATWNSDLSNTKTLYFSGNDSTVTIPAFSLTGTVLTFNAWLNTTFSSTLTNSLFTQTPQSSSIGYIWIRRDSNTNNIAWQYTNGTISPAFADSQFFTGLDGKWVFASLICDYANKKGYIYKNGVLTTSANLSGTPLFPSSFYAKNVGSWAGSVYELTDGYIDDVRLYNRALSASEIIAIYNQTKSNYE